jgi:hypothetical protein
MTATLFNVRKPAEHTRFLAAATPFLPADAAFRHARRAIAAIGGLAASALGRKSAKLPEPRQILRWRDCDREITSPKSARNMYSCKMQRRLLHYANPS